MDCEIVTVDGGQKMDSEDRPRKSQKRNRASSLVQEAFGATSEEREARLGELRKELEGLFGYYKEVMGKKVVDLDMVMEKQWRNGANAVVAALMEERDLPLSKLVEEIHGEVMKTKENGVLCCEGLMTVASVKSMVLFVGQRMMYGVPNADADILEDESNSCLWCWETRDLKLMPQSVRGVLNIRRTCRKRIHERITAVSEMVTAIEKSAGDQNYKHDLIKAADKLGKAHSEANIRQLVDGLMQKNGANQAEKEAKREEKLLVKQLERDKREAEKEKKRLEKEYLKEKLQSEKEQKRLQEEAEKDERRREREESEMRKQLRKQQEEVEKEQRRRAKEEAELKKQLSIMKQASIMERFIKRSKITPIQTDQSSIQAPTTDSLGKGHEKQADAVTQSMDCTLSSSDDINVEDITRSHLAAWRCLGRAIRSNRNQHWGIRRKPKSELFKELKLTTTRPVIAVIDELSEETLADGCGECVSDDRSCQTNASCSFPDVKKLIRAKQLLQFDKSFRPAFYGICPKKSHVVGPRHPFRKDPNLDYDIDSDEEWEEEEPGESLSDCDKDDEDESLQDGCLKADDEEESEDGFFVPDGYLSENEGVQVDRMETDDKAGEAKSSPGLDSEEFIALLRQQKYLNNLTEHALRKNQPLIISNLMHEKASLLFAEGLSGTSKLEQMCLQALSMCLFPGSSPVVISLDNVEDNEQEASASSGKDGTMPTPSSTVIAVPELDLHKLVSAIQSCPQGIHKLAESLQQKFPAFSKLQLRNKVREISDYVDNRWQVKKEVLEKVGLSISPAHIVRSLAEKSSGRTKSIAAFFSKRCLPPAAGKSINPNEISPQPSLKSSSSVEGQQSCTYN